MRQNQSKNSASWLARLVLFFCQSKLAGIIRVHPGNPWLILLQPHPARGLLQAKNHIAPQKTKTTNHRLHRLTLIRNKGCIRMANEAEPKQKLRKLACQIIAFFCQSHLDGIIRALRVIRG